MLLKIIQIDFDFTTDFDDEAPTLEEQINTLNEVNGSVWEVDDEEDLVEELTNIYGWCINSINVERLPQMTEALAETLSQTPVTNKPYKTVYLTVALRIDAAADTFETVAECDYQFSGVGVWDSEIISVTDDN